ncbi:MAG: family 43 glycosylhydrolase [Clostridia bacterium]|nr:family 43 glycosylhydrolase [Clostridia bacterium]
MYYRASGKAVCADVIPYYEDGVFYLFYLRDLREGGYAHGDPVSWCLLTTRDFVTYEEHGVVIPHGTKDDQDFKVFTGSCSKWNGEYYIFYTGDNPYKLGTDDPAEKIMLAKSDDLLHWHKVEDFMLQAPDCIDMHDFRDPFVYYDEEMRKYCMLLAGRAKSEDPSDCRGITMLFCSDDLKNWTMAEKPFYAPSAFFTHECPDLFKMGDWWYLIFSEFSDKTVTTYRMAKSPLGPWITPKVDNFDGSPYYAAKTVSDGAHRYLLGWNRIHDKEMDDNAGQWGGTIVPHELVQAEDGTLHVKCPESIRSMYQTAVSLTDGYTLGNVSPLDSGWQIGSNDTRSIKLLGKMPENCRLEMDFTLSDEVGEFGILLRTSVHENKYYAVKFEPKFNRLSYEKRPRPNSLVHTLVSHERYCPVMPGKKNHLVIIAEGSVLEVYVNDGIAMSARMFDHKEGEIGLYALHTAVKFENIALMK